MLPKVIDTDCRPRMLACVRACVQGGYGYDADKVRVLTVRVAAGDLLMRCRRNEIVRR